MAILLKIQIKGITKPPVWRRLLIPDSFDFRQLHYAIQLAFDWGNEHLYQFQKQAYSDGWCISEPEEDGGMGFFSCESMPAKKINVRKFIEHRGLEKFVYVYDFGDDWIHQIIVEQLTDEVLQLPCCLAGKGATPPENCGGPYNYEYLKELKSKHKKTNEELERLEWAFEDYNMSDGEEDENGRLQYEKPEDAGWRVFSINAFDLDDINFGLEDFHSFEETSDDFYYKEIKDDISEENIERFYDGDRTEFKLNNLSDDDMNELINAIRKVINKK